MRELNPEQRAAVDATGTVFVSAGAGTGKTAVLVERFVRAVCDGGVDVESILVITYTKRAAAELRSRIRAELRARGRHDDARELDGAWISTIHGFCNRLLKAYPFEAGLDPRFRELDEAQAAVLAGEAFDAALEEFCEREEPDRLQLLVTYGAAGLRRMLTGIYSTLRSAGRPLVLELGDRPPLVERVEVLREAARCLADDSAATDLQRENAARVLEVAGDARPEQLFDLSAHRARGERAATFEDARRAVEQAALDELARRDRDLLQLLLDLFAERYSDAKAREAALDFEDLQLLARDLLLDHPKIREREQLRFRQICVDEFQDTNRLQCDLIDLLCGSWAASAPAGETAVPPSPEAAGGTGLSRAVLPDTVPSGLAPSAAPQEPQSPRSAGLGPTDVFFVGDEFQSIYGFRHADVQVFRDRRTESGGGLALVRNYRSRPEVLAAVNFLFRAEFGDGFQPLAASGEFTDPVFGQPVELLVTDKASYADSGDHWRRAEARSVARRVKELIDAGDADAGDVVVLFAAGTDAEWYEEELRRLGVPTYRSTGRGYFGQQQVTDLLAYLRLLRNRYDDRALVGVLASPFVGVSNDALVLIRRAAGRRPLFAGIERAVPAELDERDARLVRAFRQRYDRLVAAAATLSLERLCEQVVAAHDYDLAVLAQWDGRRRYANLRKLARLARSYEELRGPDIEGFVRFVGEQEAVGAKELEAVAEEEGSGAVRLLTIHAAKGLEFKVVVVADAGRDRAAPGSDEIIALSDGRFGFRVADPITSDRRGAFAYEEVRAAREAEDRAERLRLYYVAMTRAIDRLVVAGSVDRARAADAATPMGWVLGRLDAEDELDSAGGEPVEIERDTARFVVRVDRWSPDAPVAREPEPEAAPGAQLALFSADGPPQPPEAPTLPPLAPLPPPPLHRVRRLSFTALSLFERCSYRYYAERVVGMRPREPRGTDAAGEAALAATEIGSAVHTLLEELDLAAPRVPEDLSARVLALHPQATREEVERVRAFVVSYCESGLAARLATLTGVRKEPHFAFEHDGVVLHGYLDALHLDGGRALVVDYKTNALGDAAPEEIVEHEYRLQRLVYALACFRAGADDVEVVYQFLERPEALARCVFSRRQMAEFEAELSRAIEAIHAGEFRPQPDEFVCAGCPALDVVCAGPKLRGVAAPRVPAAAAAV